LQEEGIARLPAHYAGAGGVLDPDVYQVGHHGSHNATTVAPLNAITPLMAVIPAGNWKFEKAATTNFQTHAYGHPRKDIPDSLSNAIGGDRVEPLTIMAATGQRTFVPYGVGKHIYATTWDDVVTIEARADGQLILSIAPGVGVDECADTADTDVVPFLHPDLFEWPGMAGAATDRGARGLRHRGQLHGVAGG